MFCDDNYDNLMLIRNQPLRPNSLSETGSPCSGLFIMSAGPAISSDTTTDNCNLSKKRYSRGLYVSRGVILEYDFILCSPNLSTRILVKDINFVVYKIMFLTKNVIYYKGIMLA